MCWYKIRYGLIPQIGCSEVWVLTLVACLGFAWVCGGGEDGRMWAITHHTYINSDKARAATSHYSQFGHRNNKRRRERDQKMLTSRQVRNTTPPDIIRGGEIRHTVHTTNYSQYMPFSTLGEYLNPSNAFV